MAATPAVWGQAETFHLIDAFEAQCLSLKRCQLKAHEWDRLAAAVAGRSGRPAKSGKQCRHKVEKLRKRFEAESSSGRSFWPFFERLSRLERGSTDQITKSDGNNYDNGVIKAEIEGFGEEIGKLERRRKEIMREIERDRVEMERKREMMIMEAQRSLIECIDELFHGRPNKKVKKDYDKLE